MPRPTELYGKPWSEAEFIIVLDVYIRHRREPRNRGSTFVLEAANVLGRTPASVLMRMENFASLDPEIRDYRQGLPNIRPLGVDVFNKWVQNPEGLRECAAAFSRDIRPHHTADLFDPVPVEYPSAFGRYELLDYLGEGYFGAVYSCIDPDGGDVRALKIIRTDKLADAEIVARFRREIRTLKAVRSPNIITIYEDNLDETSEFPGFIMDFATMSLAEHVHEVSSSKPLELRERPVLPRAEATSIIRQILTGLTALHGHSPPVIHRDLNPNNILRMPSGDWVLADFSLAKFLSSSPLSATFATQSRQAWGTDGYSAPEQWRDFRGADQRADIYSLGILVWDLMSSEWPPIERGNLGLPSELTKLVYSATQRSVADRPKNVEEFARAFESAIEKAD